MPAGDMDALPPWLKREKIMRTVSRRNCRVAFFARRRSRSPIEGFSRTLPPGGLRGRIWGFRRPGKARSRCLTRLVDARVLSFAAKLDGCPWRTHKFVMRRALKKRLPADITSRPKTSGISQLSDFFLTTESDWVDRFVRDAGLTEWIDLDGLPPSRTWGYEEIPNPASWQGSLSCPLAENVSDERCAATRGISGLPRRRPRRDTWRRPLHEWGCTPLGRWLQG